MEIENKLMEERLNQLKNQFVHDKAKRKLVLFSIYKLNEEELYIEIIQIFESKVHKEAQFGHELNQGL